VTRQLWESIWPILECTNLFGWLSDAEALRAVSILKATGVAPNIPNCYLENPVAPLNEPTVRRRRNFGRRSPTRSAVHDTPSPFWLMHMAWRFCSPNSREEMCKTHVCMADYARLRLDAFIHRLVIREALRAPRKPPELEPPLDPFRARFMGAALLSFDFDYGDLVRWLEGEYTNKHRDWDALQQQVNLAMQTPQLDGYPALEPDMAMRGFREGVPLAGNFVSKRADLARRLHYDNHPPLAAHLQATREKFAKEEAKSFHIAFPRFVAHFMLGLMISPLSWVVQKDKGRIIVDSSTKLGDDDTGAPNDQIPKPGTPGRKDENPPVFYGSALRRHLQYVYNLRIQHPTEDILQHTDDIDSAYRRTLYHPDVAVVFGYVLMEFVIVPVGETFGSKNSPSFFMIPAEIRAHLGAVLDYSQVAPSVAHQVEIPAAPTEAERGSFVLAVRDSLNPGIPPDRERRRHLSMFVDDDITAAIRRLMRDALIAAVESAFQVFGYPGEDRRGSCFAADKFEMVASHRVKFVGYIIDSRLMRVFWPDDKVFQLRAMLDDWITQTNQRHPEEIAKLLGYIRNGAFLCAQGEFFSIRLQWTLSSAMKADGYTTTQKKGWWRRRRVKIPSEVVSDLRLLRASLFQERAGAMHQWSRPIALLIPREPTWTVYSDAAHSGLGGWSPDLKFVWRVTYADMVATGFPMKELDDQLQERYRWCRAQELPEGHTELLHINPLEFIAIFINVWFAIHAIKNSPDKLGGHHVLVRADNTSALSWLRYAARDQRRQIRNLAYLLHGFLLFSQTSEVANFVGEHIPGKENDEADAASRPEKYPSLASAITAFSRLQSCQPYLLPSEMLSLIAKWISQPVIAATFDEEMICLLNLVPMPSPAGAIDIPLGSGIFATHLPTRS
jgi:hypothetical protein